LWRKIRNSVARPVPAAVYFGGKLANVANHPYHLELSLLCTLNFALCTFLQQQTSLPQHYTAETIRSAIVFC
jgi:hypothetical protein